ncbi:hypothetical protein Glove_712g22 [Diversispora epigaea]|uniref:GOST seven transmembrane domain-containing protein n=1 Tax=Diversispora epigaea TaxID=1348612 RepID=A0A397G113_9GLOM|nr:hypothetical protein Glove_712g22 [Diversispora epigaea]
MARLILWSLLVILVSLLSSIKANIDILTNDPSCSGMFGKSAIPGGSDPKITAEYLDGSVASAIVIIFEWSDIHKFDIKKGENVFVVTKGAKSIWTGTLNSSSESSKSHIYNVSRTGYYCAWALRSDVDSVEEFSLSVDWNNPYGELPAADYPKLPFYGLLSLVYLAIGIAWMALSIAHWRDILQVQNYISGVILFLMLEMAFNWGYWENYNTYGYPSKFLLGLVAILNAGRNSISFFMLLIVCMGYGVVKPTLGSTMNRCRALGIAHFIFGVIYAAGTMLINPYTTNPLIFLVIFPLAFTMTAFYIWTLQSITNTLQTLEIRRQNVKALMYKRLYRLLIFSVTVLGIFFLINTFNYTHREDMDWIAKYWQWRWFLLDGWLNVLYLIVFSVILIIWRPTRNNKRYPFILEHFII